MFEEITVRAGDDMGAYEFTDLAGGFGTGFDGGFYAADITFDDGGYITSTDLDGFHQFHAGGLDHGIAGFNGTGEAFGFD
jgi:hypothetical protein